MTSQGIQTVLESHEETTATELKQEKSRSRFRNLEQTLKFERSKDVNALFGERLLRYDSFQYFSHITNKVKYIADPVKRYFVGVSGGISLRKYENHLLVAL